MPSKTQWASHCFPQAILWCLSGVFFFKCKRWQKRCSVRLCWRQRCVSRFPVPRNPNCQGICFSVFYAPLMTTCLVCVGFIDENGYSFLCVLFETHFLFNGSFFLVIFPFCFLHGNGNQHRTIIFAGISAMSHGPLFQNAMEQRAEGIARL